MPKKTRSVKELKLLLTELGLSTTGRKEDLLRRLEGVIHADGRNPEIADASEVFETSQNRSGSDDGDNLLAVANEPVAMNQQQLSRPNEPVTFPIELNREREQFNQYVVERERELLDRERELFEREKAFLVSTELAEQREAPRNAAHNKRAFTIREISDSLPEFIPMDTTKGDAARFVKRIRDLQDVYEWDEKLLLFAAQTRLRAQARIWNDNHVTVFRTFNEFAKALQSVFPPSETDTDIHIQMLDTQRLSNEGLQEYYFRMCALGQKGGISEAATILYIRRGLKDTALQNVLVCIEVTTLAALHNAIKRYCENSSQCSGTPNWRTSIPQRAGPYSKPFENITATVNNGAVGPGTDLRPRGRRCYNCSEMGHIASACSQPPRRDKCSVCSRYGHRAAECRTKPFDTPVLRIADEQCEPVSLRKKILINDKPFTATLDGGSTKSLIRRTSALAAGRIEPCTPFNFKGFGGSTVPSAERLIAAVVLDGKAFEGLLYIVDDLHLPSDVLLGTDILCQKGRRLVIEETSCRVESEGDISGRPEQPEIEILIKAFPDCFADNIKSIGRYQTGELEITLTSNKPVNRHSYRVPFARQQIVASIVEELLANGIIKPSDSPYASPIVLVQKQNGEFRMCVDYRELNSITQKVPFPMPVVDEMLAVLSGNRYFTTLDLMSGYYQIPVSENSQKYTAFVTHEGHYEFTRMPFGLVNAPSVFQKLMNKMQKKLPHGEMVVYLDDMIIPSKTKQEGIDKLERVLREIRENGLTLRLSKCVFLAEKIKFLGHNISANGIDPGDEKVAAIQNFPVPSDVHGVRSFLGLTGFFRKFIKDYAVIARPLTDLTKTTNAPKFKWNNDAAVAFEHLKLLLTSEPVLCLYNPQKNHEVHTDASSVGLAGILMQEEEKGIYKPVFYFSRRCSNQEGQYHSYELEVLAIVESVKRFEFYLLGKHFRIITDCAAVTTTRMSTPLLPRIARWWLKLGEFDFELVHRPGRIITHADALSRTPNEPAKPMTVVTEDIMRIEISQIDWLITMQQQDPKLLKIMQALRGDIIADDIRQLNEDYTLQNARLFRKIGTSLKWVVPAGVRWRIVKSSHDDRGHFGWEKTLQHVQKDFWFPRMRNYVKGYLAACIECAYNKRPGGATEGRMHISDTIAVPFRTAHLDHLGPFPKSTRGNQYVIAFVDEFSKYVVLKAVKSTESRHVITMLNELTVYFGLPTRIVTDRGTAFTSRAFEEYCTKHTIKHIKNAVRTPRANGQVERVNGVIANFLRLRTEESRKWDAQTTSFQWIINGQVNKTIGCSPNDVIFRFQLRDNLENKIVGALRESFDADPPEVPSYDQIAERIDAAKAKWKARFDNCHKNPTNFNADDLVLVESIAAATGESRKLEPKYRGPYVVIKVLDNDRYLVGDLGDIQRNQRPFQSVFSSDKMKKWCQLGPETEEDVEEVDRDGQKSGKAELSAGMKRTHSAAEQLSDAE